MYTEGDKKYTGLEASHEQERDTLSLWFAHAERVGVDNAEVPEHLRPFACRNARRGQSLMAVESFVGLQSAGSWKVLKVNSDFSILRRRFLQAGAAFAAASFLPTGISRAAGVDERRLTIAPGRASLLGKGKPETDVWTYDGVVPGPLLRVRQVLGGPQPGGGGGGGVGEGVATPFQSQ